MTNQELKQRVVHQLLPRVQTPGQYIGGELNAVVKDHRQVRGKVCLAFPDTYAIGMSHHGLQVLYAAMNGHRDWVCERVFAPGRDLEDLLRAAQLPLYGLESFTPLPCFDVLGFTLQYDLCCTNVLTILDLGRIPLAADQRQLEHPLVIAGGPGVMNPEPMARFFDLFVIGDGEETLPQVCEAWLQCRSGAPNRREALLRMARQVPHIYVPGLYAPPGGLARGRLQPLHEGITETVSPAVLTDLNAVPLPTRPVVPNVECVQDRIAVEIMRGCPGRCRFCQSTTLKRPLRWRRVETIVEAAVESYRNTGYNEVSLLSLSTSDYPQFDLLVRRLQEELRPLGVSLSVPSLRINEQLRTIGDLLNTDRTSGLTLAPEVARDAMRVQVGKRIRNEDLYEGCRSALAKGFHRVKLYFMCGLPGEQEADLDGMIEMAETIVDLGRQIRGRPPTVVVNVSNFVPKPQTPYQWAPMQTREYFRAAHQHLRRRVRTRAVQIKCHDVEASLLEGVLSRGDRRLGPVIEDVWRRGARFDAWSDQLRAELWWEALAEAGLAIEEILHQTVSLDTPLPWDHVGIRQGRGYLEREHSRAALCEGNQDRPG